MRVGVIRGDLSGPVCLTDLEPVSQFDPSCEPIGQERYLTRPRASVVSALVANLPASIFGEALAFPLTITENTNDDIRIRASATGQFTVVTVAADTYATLADLVDAVNAGLVTAQVNDTFIAGVLGNRLTLSTLAVGPGTYIGIDTIAQGSTFNDAGRFTDGDVLTLPTGAAVIEACCPVGGPLDVSVTTLRATLGAISGLLCNDIADAIAPRIFETVVAVQSFQRGSLAGYKSATFVPDPSRKPAMTAGPAIAVVADDGVTAFTAAVPAIGTAAPGTTPESIIITGSGLANPEDDLTVVKIMYTATGKTLRLEQSTIRRAGGSVTATSIILPGAVFTGHAVPVVGDKVQVRYGSFVSNIRTIAAIPG